MDEKDKNYLNNVINSNDIKFIPEQFLAMYNEDSLGGIIRNVEFWITDIFKNLVIKK